jgi:nickel/cobalt transporter (NicO) family protein
MELGYIIIFWYGVLHAFGPDHLTAIADFSIGRSLKKSFFITVMFAFGHGLMLFLFAKLLQEYSLPPSITENGDIISSSVIIAMGFYLLYMAAADKININHHNHGDEKHLHISFSKQHAHSTSLDSTSAWSMGALMGMGGVRGMLITLGMLQGVQVNWIMILAFVAGVSVVFLSFGFVILQINNHFLKSKRDARRIFAVAGLISVFVGSQIWFT